MAASVRSGRWISLPLRLWQAGSPDLLIAAIPIVAFTLVAAFGPMLIEYDHVHARLTERLLPPGASTTSGVALFGTDQIGRDLFGQVVYGARISLAVGFATVLLAGVAGTAVGIIAGYAGGAFDSGVMRLADIQLSLPAFLLAILIAAVIGPSVTNVILVLALTRWVVFARVARASTLATKERDYVDSARVLGASKRRIVLRHIAPETITPILIVVTTSFGLVILAEASLSFLNLGTPGSVPSWGQTIANGRDHLATAWWISTIAGLVLALVAVAFALFGDRLRDELDPRMKSM